MAGHLSVNPFIKTFDECQRSLKRQQTYMEINGHLLDAADRHKAEKVIEHLEKVLEYIPKEYKLTKHDLRKLKEKEE